MIDPSFTRWIHASIRQFILDRRQAKGETIHIFNEADIRETNKYPEHLELRIDGPYERHVGTKNDNIIDIEINILINTTYFEQDIFKHQTNMGLAAYLLDASIPIYKMGKVSDDRSHIGVLTKQSDLITTNFGQIDIASQIQQATVEAHYTFEEC